MRVLVIDDPDEWVQEGRPLYVVELSEDKGEKFYGLGLSATGSELREWLRLNGIQLAFEVPLSSIDYVVCSWA